MISFSIVIPTYNEEGDIRRTCESLVNLEYPEKEIILVDGGSTDNTIKIISAFVEKYGFKLLYQPIRGVGVPRNMGIREATGDVVVILNADVFPRPDFLRRILVHYQNGAEAVAVDSEVVNTQDVLGRYARALHVLFYGGDKPVGWTEGFSCRRKAAIEAGLFPEEIPAPCGEDVDFYNRLKKVAPRQVLDKTIVVPHVAPGDLRTYWRQQLTRGWGVPYINYFIYKKPLFYVVARVVLGTGRTLAELLLVFPTFIRAIRLSALSPNGYRDFFPFWGVDMLRLIVGRLGHWRGLVDLIGKLNLRQEESLLEREDK